MIAWSRLSWDSHLGPECGGRGTDDHHAVGGRGGAVVGIGAGALRVSAVVVIAGLQDHHVVTVDQVDEAVLFADPT